jgi:hypothetical protein
LRLALAQILPQRRGKSLIPLLVFARHANPMGRCRAARKHVLSFVEASG